jgi:hypothetical protein
VNIKKNCPRESSKSVKEICGKKVKIDSTKVQNSEDSVVNKLLSQINENCRKPEILGKRKDKKSYPRIRF